MLHHIVNLLYNVYPPPPRNREDDNIRGIKKTNWIEFFRRELQPYEENQVDVPGCCAQMHLKQPNKILILYTDNMKGSHRHHLVCTLCAQIHNFEMALSG